MSDEWNYGQNNAGSENTEQPVNEGRSAAGDASASFSSDGTESASASAAEQEVSSSVNPDVQEGSAQQDSAQTFSSQAFSRQDSTSQDFRSQNDGTQNISAQDTGAQDTGTQNDSSQTYGSQTYGSQAYGSQDTGAQNSGTQNYGSRNDYYAQNSGTQNYGSQNDGYTQNYGSQNYGSQNYGSQNYSSQNYASGNSGSQNSGYAQNSGSQNYGSQNGSYAQNPGSQNYGSQNDSYAQNSGSQNYSSQDNGYAQNSGNRNYGSQNDGYTQNYGSQNYGSQNNGSQNYGSQNNGYTQNYGSQNSDAQSGGQNFTMPGYQDPGTDVTRYDGRQNSGYDTYQFSSQPAGGQPSGGSDKPPKKSSGLGRKIGIGAAIAGVCALVAALVFLGVSLLGNAMTGNHNNGNNQQSSAAISKPDQGTDSSQSSTAGSTESKGDASSKTDSSSDTGTAVNNSDGDMSIEQVAANVMPSMVAITTKTVQQVQSFFTGETQEYEAEADGSGIIVGQTDTELLIATNNHVISGSDTISVAFVDNTAASATIKGTNADEDLAVVAVQLSDLTDDTKSKISVITIGDSDSCQVGESVVAIGNALGYGQSVSSGIISALNRTVTVDNVSHTLLQTDAAINPGNSGGALLNMKGELIGINEVKYSDTTVEGMGYAIPISKAEPILNKLMNKADRQKVDDSQASYLGVSVKTMPTAYVQQGYPAGAYVDSVVSGGAADKAGIKEGDIITAIDGYSVTSADDLVEELTYYAAGTTIDFSVSRLNSDQTAYETQTVSVTLGAKADADVSGSTSQSTDSQADSGTQQGQGGSSQLPNGTSPFQNGTQQLPGSGQ